MKASRSRDAQQAGFSLPELLVVLLLMGLVLAASAAAWQSYRRATNTRTAAQTVKMGIHQARLMAIFNGVSHFVAIDPATRTVGVYEDSGLPAGSFDAADALISETRWESGVAMDLPPGVLPRPMGMGNLADAWDLPTPDSAALWGTDLVGLMATPDGRILSAEATPTLIGIGTIVLNDPMGEGQTAGIAVEGLSGTVRSFKLNGNSWETM